mgnify:CR=1 FL=1
MAHLLIVEDDDLLRDGLTDLCRQAGHTVHSSADGLAAQDVLNEHTVDAVLLDLGLPKIDGMQLLKWIRLRFEGLPVMILTARDSVDDRVEWLLAGADDYLTKPFAFAELMARVNALARRPPVQEVKTVLRVADLELDLMRRMATRSGQPIELLPKEFTLLEVLMRNEGRVVTRTMLLERVWDFHFDPKTSVVETHISRLRAKVDKPFEIALLHTVKNMGYSLHAPR